MPRLRPCPSCGRPRQGQRCPCGWRADRKAPTSRTPNYSYAERQRRAQAVAEHRARYGNVCPGWDRPAHYSTDLTADHLTPVADGGPPAGPLRVLCRGCNSRRAAEDRRPNR